MNQALTGFSFSLNPDGSSGSYNRALARHILSLDLTNTGLYLQWEIAEALREEDLKAFSQLKSRMQIVSPPLFPDTEIDFKDLNGLERTNHHLTTLKNLVTNTDGQDLRESINKLLQDANLFKQFQGLELKHLVREELGPLFTELRILPNPEDYPTGLGSYQCIRVNRLILSAIVNNSSLIKTLPYITTLDVIEETLISMTNHAVNHIGIVAHPLHAPRCQQLLDAAIAQKGLKQTTYRESIETPSWDQSSAQVWCQSEANFLAYEKKVAELLARG